MPENEEEKTNEQYDEEWRGYFQRAIQLIEAAKANKYSQDTLDAMYELLRYEIPPARVFRIAKELCKITLRKKLPLAEDFLRLHEGPDKLDYKYPGTYGEGKQTCEKGCYKGLVGLIEVRGMTTLTEYENDDVGRRRPVRVVSLADTCVVYYPCDCRYSRRVHPNAHHDTIKIIENAGIEFEIVNGIFMSLRYDRALRVRLRNIPMPGVPDKPRIVEFNTSDWSPHDVKPFVMSLDDPTSIRKETIEEITDGKPVGLPMKREVKKAMDDLHIPF